jgi:NAD(P)-dependent dehydrogenase (short-subunit alcohol dehydrogenase family)
MRLADKAAIVTGAGSGIGRATTHRLAGEGASVLAIDRDGEGLAETARLGNGPGGIETLVADVTDGDAPAAAFARCPSADILVNNAGIGDARAAHLTGDDDLDRYLDTNLRSLFRFSRQAVGAMAAGGCIVNIASIFGITGFRGSAPYSATKAAVIGLTRNMAADYGPAGIRVNAIAPGVIETPLVADRLAGNAWFVDALVGGTPLGRTGKPEEIAAAIAFLCSDDAAFISGHTLVVDGGFSATHFRARPEDEA